MGIGAVIGSGIFTLTGTAAAGVTMKYPSVLHAPVMGYLRWFHNRTRATLVPTDAQRQELATAGFRSAIALGRGVDASLYHPRKRDEALRRGWRGRGNRRAGRRAHTHTYAHSRAQTEETRTLPACSSACAMRTTNRWLASFL